MRTFIAIPLNDACHKELAGLINRLRTCGADVKWTEPSNIHLTLKFLGEIDEAGLKQIKSFLNKIAGLHKPFSIRIAGTGAFPKISYPRVVWAGIDEGETECLAINKNIEDAMEKLGFKKEDRPFTAHLTLGRVRSNKNRAGLTDTIEKEKDFVSSDKVPVQKIILFQSTLTPKGPIYSVLQEFQFA